MFKILKQPYPFSEKSPKQILIQSILEGAFIAIFLIIIEPFGISNWEIPNKSLHLIAYGLMTSACVFTLRFFVFKKFDKYSDQANWTILREIVSIFTLILLITTGNYFLTFLLFKTTLNIFSFSNMLFMVATIGVFPIVFGVMLNYIYQLKKYNKPIDITHTFTKDLQNDNLKLFAENEKDFIELLSENLFYVESADNYSTIYFEKDGLKKELIRSSLIRIESQINSKNIVRCHRSFIVNLDKVIKVSGNAQGFKLHLEGYNLYVPVARKYNGLVEKLK